MNQATVAGASGAICGVLGAFMALRLPHWPALDRRNLATVAIETASMIGVVSWLIARTPPSMPNRLSALMWHFIPFLTAWAAVRLGRQTSGAAEAT